MIWLLRVLWFVFGFAASRAFGGWGAVVIVGGAALVLVTTLELDAYLDSKVLDEIEARQRRRGIR